MKLVLCALSVSNNALDLLILDEPCNNLDIQSKQVLTHAVKEYKGTLIVVSHDSHFIEDVNINKTHMLGND